MHGSQASTSTKRNVVSCRRQPLFLADQFKVVTKNMQGEPILPTEEDYAGVEAP
jgi:hypothetical protein